MQGKSIKLSEKNKEITLRPGVGKKFLNRTCVLTINEKNELY